VHPLGRLTPAPLEFDPGGTPWSARHGDVYHTRAGGFAQARAVFMAGCRLPERWQGQRGFTIVETGFGLGTNFLATWATWRDDPKRSRRLDFVSIEVSPFSAADLLAWHAPGSEGHDLARQLAAAWPPAIAGVHRLEFEGGRVVLTLVLGEFAAAAARLRLRADAFYLDGFAPSRNPDAWSPALMRLLARLAADESGPAGAARLGTWTTARRVVDALAEAGFKVWKAEGFGGKRERLEGQFAPRWTVRRRNPPKAAIWPVRDVVVIGAGISGIACASRLAARGWQVRVIEAGPQALSGASGLARGAIHPLFARTETQLARLVRAGFLWQCAMAPSLVETTGHLHLADDARDAEGQSAALAELGLPVDHVHRVDAERASNLAGQSISVGGLYYPGAGALAPARLASLQFEAHGERITLACGQAAARLVRGAGRWQVLDAEARLLADASVVIIATGATALEVTLEGDDRALVGDWDPVRGQLTAFEADSLRGPACAVGGDGHCLPASEGQVWSGATYARGERSGEARSGDDETNRLRLARLLPGSGVAGARVSARFVGVRAVASDRMPLVGAIADLAAVRADPQAWRAAHLPDLPRIEGLYACTAMGSRGLSWSGICAETVASLIEGEPPPLESDLLEAIDPARRLLDRLRHGRLTRA
jgi:tRNA 5-methylaminomethyl-2-thiouridine biosynthesis bifunctional protein